MTVSRSDGNRLLPSPGTTPRMAAKHILLAENDEALAHVMALLLKQAEFKVSTVKSCAEALQVLARQAAERAERAPVDLLITAVHRLPEDEEKTLLAAMAAGRINMPVIAITGHDDAALLHALNTTGCAVCITKPFAAETLMNGIQTVLQSEEKRQGEA